MTCLQQNGILFWNEPLEIYRRLPAKNKIEFLEKLDCWIIQMLDCWILQIPDQLLFFAPRSFSTLDEEFSTGFEEFSTALLSRINNTNKSALVLL